MTSQTEYLKDWTDFEEKVKDVVTQKRKQDSLVRLKFVILFSTILVMSLFSFCYLNVKREEIFANTIKIEKESKTKIANLDKAIKGFNETVSNLKFDNNEALVRVNHQQSNIIELQNLQQEVEKISSSYVTKKEINNLTNLQQANNLKLQRLRDANPKNNNLLTTQIITKQDSLTKLVSKLEARNDSISSSLKWLTELYNIQKMRKTTSLLNDKDGEISAYVHNGIFPKFDYSDETELFKPASTFEEQKSAMNKNLYSNETTTVIWDWNVSGCGIKSSDTLNQSLYNADKMIYIYDKLGRRKSKKDN